MHWVIIPICTIRTARKCVFFIHILQHAQRSHENLIPACAWRSGNSVFLSNWRWTLRVLLLISRHRFFFSFLTPDRAHLKWLSRNYFSNTSVILRILQRDFFWSASLIQQSPKPRILSSGYLFLEIFHDKWKCENRDIPHGDVVLRSGTYPLIVSLSTEIIRRTKDWGLQKPTFPLDVGESWNTNTGTFPSEWGQDF